MKLKKAAMFGLDARIALAIFGALSVISGAALYSAIQNAKVTALQTEFSEAQKAWEAYYLDTGVVPPRHSGDVSFFDASYLVEDNSVTGWKGPYLPFVKDSSTTYRLKHNNYYQLIYVNALSSNAWGEGGDNWSAHKCLQGVDNCYSWVMIIGSKDLSLVQELDKRYDGTVSATEGNFRYYQSGGDYRMMLKNILYK